MKKKSTFFLPAICILLAFSISHLITIPGSYAKGPKKVAILPFAMHADRDLTFLQDGIVDMLGSRLAWKGEVEVIEKEIVRKKVAEIKGPLNKEKAIVIGKALNANYVILGSLTVFGESVSIDSKILDVALSQELVTAFNQSKGMDEVIPTITQFAQDINDKIMGRVVRPPPVHATAPEAPQGPGTLIRTGKGVKAARKVGHVQRFKLEIVGMDTGDVDGDGKKELVVIDKDTVYVYKWRNRSFSQFKVIKGKWSPNYIYVSVADLDNNGRAEIYVSSLSAATVSSFVLEWQESQFKTIASGQSWLFRVIDIPGKGKTLVGQKREIDGAYMGEVHLLKREESRFTPAGSLKLPRFGNVFNFALAPFSHPQKPHTVMLNPYERLQVSDPQGEELWRSDEFFGGSLNFIEDKSGDSREGGLGKRLYIPSPIFLADVDDDGRQEVVVCQNKSTTGRITEHLRSFSSGMVHFMTWDGVALSTQWTSQKLGGAVVGYRVDDVDSDGQPELVVAAVTGVGFILEKPRSQVVVYDLK